MLTNQPYLSVAIKAVMMKVRSLGKKKKMYWTNNEVTNYSSRPQSRDIWLGFPISLINLGIERREFVTTLSYPLTLRV